MGEGYKLPPLALVRIGEGYESPPLALARTQRTAFEKCATVRFLLCYDMSAVVQAVRRDFSVQVYLGARLMTHSIQY